MASLKQELDAIRLSSEGDGTKPGRIALVGMSLGGYTAALYATVEEPPFVAPMIPVASFPDLLWSHGEGRPERARAEREGITLAMLRQDIAPQLAEVYPQFTAALFGA